MRAEEGEPSLARAQAGVLAHARAAEGQGVDLVWLAERPFGPDVAVPVAWPLAAALAATTTRLRIGVGPLPLPLVHPLRVAEDAATVDGLSAGRLELAVGLGAHREAFDAFGVLPAERVARFEDAVALLRAAFGDGPIDHGGSFHDARAIDVHPKPVQRPGPPVWIGAAALPAVARAARLGDGLLCQTAAVAHTYLAARAAGAVEPARIGLLLDAGEEDAALLSAVRDTAQMGGGGARLSVDLVLCVGAPHEAPAPRVAELARSLAVLAGSI